MRVVRRVKFVLRHPVATARYLVSGDRTSVEEARVLDDAEQCRKANPGVPTELDELSEYLQLPRPVVALNMARGPKLVAARWSRENPQTDEAVREFYRHCLEYLYDLCWYNRTLAYQQLLALLDAERGGTCLSFGGGIGTEALKLATQGNAVYYLDIPGSPVWRFAQWRAQMRKIPILFSGTVPDDIQFDCVVAFDVFEHLTTADLEAPVTRLIAALKPGGRLYVNNAFGVSSSNPMHQDHQQLWDSLVAGLPLGKVNEHLYLRDLGVGTLC